MATWYVRPDTSHSGTRNGTSYATAWGGWSAIVWGAGGVAAGDTLYVCGSHSLTANAGVGNHGSIAGAPCVIRGDYAGDAGSFAFTGAYFCSLPRSYTTLLGLTFNGGTSHCVYVSGTPSGISIVGCRFNSAAKAAIQFDGANGTAYADMLLSGNTFSGDCRDGGTTTGAINWFVSTASAVSTMTRLTISDNRFEDLIVGRSVVHLRVEDDTSTSTKMVDLVITDNSFTRTYGVCIEANNGFATFGNSTGIKVQRNTFTDTSVVPSGTTGGCMFIWGFTGSAALGRPLIEDNIARSCVGAVGLANVFYGDYIVRRNKAYGLSTETIDACGVLFDFGCNGATAYGNEFYDLTGKAGVSNSGVAIMVLDSQNVRAYSNLAVRCKVGIHIGDEATTQSSVIDGNTFLECSLYGIEVRANADEANSTARDNAFTAASGTAVSVNNLGGAWSGEDYNVFYGFAVPSGHTLGANGRTDDPLLSSDYRPLPGSPLLTGGTSTIRRDINGVQGRNFIGAYAAASLRQK